MTKSKRFKPIVKLAESKEQQAAQVFGKSQQVLTAHELRLNELKTYRAEYMESFMSAGGQGISIAHMRNYRTFLGNLDKAIAQQETIVTESSTAMNKDKSQWFESLSRKKALCKVVDKYKYQEQRKDARNEQKEADDRTSGPRKNK